MREIEGLDTQGLGGRPAEDLRDEARSDVKAPLVGETREGIRAGLQKRPARVRGR